MDVSASAAPGPPTVLIVEDNFDNLAICSTILRHDGFRVLEAGDGESGVAAAREHLPDVILMDIALPLLDGWAATRQLKTDPATRAIPVIALTAHALEEHRVRSAEAGCDGFLTKPIEPRAVVDAVRRVLTAAPRFGGDGQSAPARAAASDAASDAVAPPLQSPEHMEQTRMTSPHPFHPHPPAETDLRNRLASVFGAPDDPMHEVEERAARLLPDSQAIVWEGDAATFQFGYVGRAAEELLGYPALRWTAEPTFWADVVVHPDDRDHAVSYCALCTGKGIDHDFEYRARTADGRDVRLYDVVRVIKGGKGIATRLRGIMLDLDGVERAAGRPD